MAVNPSTKWPTRTTAVAPAFPYGSSKDETTPGANDGTPYEKARADDIFGLQQALLKFAGIVPSGNADTAQASQYLEALLVVAMGGGFFDDTGAADTYLFTILAADRQGPVAYVDGMRVSAAIANTNTGVSTVNVNSIGVKNIFYKGSALTAGLLTAGDVVALIYDLANDRFNLIESDRLFADLASVQTLINKTVQDSTFKIQDETNLTAFAQFQTGAITPGTTREYTLPDNDGTLMTEIQNQSKWPNFMVNMSAQQDDITGEQKILFAAEDEDRGPCFGADAAGTDPAANRLNPGIDCRMFLTIQLQFVNCVDGDEIGVLIKKNGTAINTRAKTVTGVSEMIPITALVNFNGTTDYVEIFGINNNRDTSDVDHGAETWFHGSRVA